ncbi:hypothetical protein FP435_00445 (plasmid) [Lactobacillus sp. PV037]|uniref:hypothetical protein n=1 Tax=Lactobacillus sp. PV037 TaxID=2594496 RepID=UPI00223F509D|nr:hypothetical protein [Lactobacillus sp. PV037]QNQ83006.1 hypothetical protein FP435_00445 [Lactobacillus sp. PV037]
MNYQNSFDEYKFSIHRMLVSLGLKDQPASALMKKNARYIERCYGSKTYHETNRRNGKTAIVTAEMTARIIFYSLKKEKSNESFFRH